MEFLFKNFNLIKYCQTNIGNTEKAWESNQKAGSKKLGILLIRTNIFAQL